MDRTESEPCCAINRTLTCQAPLDVMEHTVSTGQAPDVYSLNVEMTSGNAQSEIELS